jgi:micrococcal nuclease
MIAALVAAACDGAAPCGPADGVVADVIDGDTIVLASGERVRYLLVDTPESTGGTADCFGASAARFNRDLVLGRTVSLSYGEVCDDRYGRPLAYVRVDGVDVGELLVSRGYACVLHIPPAGDDRVAAYRSLEDQARGARRGLWGACEDAPCD